MEEENNNQSSVQINQLICPVCHQPVLETWYFCPNCGTKLKATPLSVSFNAKLSLYLISFITPLLAFITIGYWKGWKYFRSNESQAKIMGIISIIIMVVVTVALVWLTIYFTEQSISQVSSLTSGLSGSLNGL